MTPGARWVGATPGVVTNGRVHSSDVRCAPQHTAVSVVYLGGLSGSEGQRGTRSEERPVHDTEADLV